MRGSTVGALLGRIALLLRVRLLRVIALLLGRIPALNGVTALLRRIVTLRRRRCDLDDVDILVVAGRRAALHDDDLRRHAVAVVHHRGDKT